MKKIFLFILIALWITGTSSFLVGKAYSTHTEPDELHYVGDLCFVRVTYGRGRDERDIGRKKMFFNNANAALLELNLDNFPNDYNMFLQMVAANPGNCFLADMEMFPLDPLRIGSINRFESAPLFKRGDVNEDGVVDTADIVSLDSIIRRSGINPKCMDRADVNDNGVVNKQDRKRLRDFILQSGTPPAKPFPDPGQDPTPDVLSCSW